MKKAFAALLCTCLLGLLCACAQTQTAPGDIPDPAPLAAEENSSAASAPQDKKKPEEDIEDPETGPEPMKEPRESESEEKTEPEQKEGEDMRVITDPDTGRTCSATRLVVKPAEDVPEDELKALFEENGLSVRSHRKSSNLYVVETEDAMNIKRMEALTEILLESEYVAYVSKDYVNELH